jgi:hypothetical protein
MRPCRRPTQVGIGTVHTPTSSVHAVARQWYDKIYDFMLGCALQVPLALGPASSRTFFSATRRLCRFFKTNANHRHAHNRRAASPAADLQRYIARSQEILAGIDPRIQRLRPAGGQRRRAFASTKLYAVTFRGQDDAQSGR